MTTIHLDTEAGHRAAMLLKENSRAAMSELQSLRSSLQTLDSSWQGGSQADFTEEAVGLMSRLQAQIDALQVLSDRLEREVTEWEQVDRKGAAAGGPGGWLGTIPLGSIPVMSGGGGSTAFQSPILPLFAGLSIGSLLAGLPPWLQGMIDRFFPQPVPMPSVTEAPEPKTGDFGDLIDKTEPVTPSAAPAALPSAPPYDITPQSQGGVYGNHGCLLTSMSMVMAYYHAKDPDLKAPTPQELEGMVDPGDGTTSTGIALDKLNDDAAELGYQSTVKAGTMQDLETNMKAGPVIVNVEIGIVNGPPRDITLTGSTNHAIVVKNVTADTVIVNDPWSGAEKSFSRASFEKIWSKGQNYMVIVRPGSN